MVSPARDLLPVVFVYRHRRIVIDKVAHPIVFVVIIRDNNVYGQRGGRSESSRSNAPPETAMSTGNAGETSELRGNVVGHQGVVHKLISLHQS